MEVLVLLPAGCEYEGDVEVAPAPVVSVVPVVPEAPTPVDPEVLELGLEVSVLLDPAPIEPEELGFAPVVPVVEDWPSVLWRSLPVAPGFEVPVLVPMLLGWLVLEPLVLEEPWFASVPVVPVLLCEEL